MSSPEDPPDVSLDFLEADRCFRVVVKGTFNERALHTIRQRLSSHPDYRGEFTVLWDVREADLSALQARDMERYRLSAAPARALKICILVSGKLQHAIARQFFGHISPSYELMITSDEAQAARFCKL